MICDHNDISDTKNNTSYKFITKNRSYIDISNLGILKTLYKNHKINRYEYKNSIKRIVNKKRLKTNINNRIHFYLTTLKTNTNKSTITALKRRTPINKRFINIDYKNQKYSVYIKKPKFIQLVYNKHLCPEYKDLMINSITKEFNKYMKVENTI